MKPIILHLKPNSHKTETWVASLNEEVIGHIHMDREEINKLKFSDAWVHPEHRRKGIYRLLWETRWEYVNQKYKGWTVYAWCKDNSLPLLIEKDFTVGEKCTYVEKVI
jgi:GNAT superfamily N-acetyltransferase